MFLADMGEVVRDGLEMLGREAFQPGDVYISNDPYTIGTHLNNVATYSPIFSGLSSSGSPSPADTWSTLAAPYPGRAQPR